MIVSDAGQIHPPLINGASAGLITLFLLLPELRRMGMAKVRQDKRHPLNKVPSRARPQRSFSPLVPRITAPQQKKNQLPQAEEYVRLVTPGRNSIIS
jgi:hypothetical protein